MAKWIYRIIPKIRKSGTARCAKPVDAFNELIGDILENKNEDDKAYFTARKYKGWAKVYLKNGNIVVTFKFPFRNSPAEVFTEKGLIKPEGWGEGGYKPGKTMIFRLSQKHKDSIGPFLDSAFRKLYDCPENYVLRGEMLLGPPP